LCSTASLKSNTMRVLSGARQTRKPSTELVAQAIDVDDNAANTVPMSAQYLQTRVKDTGCVRAGLVE